MQRLVLIDGNAILYRAFYALPETLTLKDGSPVNAVYGFTSMLLSVVEKLNPNYLICAFDLPKPTFRDKLYEDYRAQRPPTPEKLIAQIEMVKNVVRAFKIPIYEAEGYEADDVIGTLAKQAKEASSGTNFSPQVQRRSAPFLKDARKDSSTLVESNTKSSLGENLGKQLSSKDSKSTKFSTPFKRAHSHPRTLQSQSIKFLKKLSSSKTLRASHPTSQIETIIVTGDRDLLQLVDKYTKVYVPIKGLSQGKLFGVRQVEEKYGIHPKHMVDYKALVGDPSDNYPGVKGIGPKTAQNLIKKFKKLEKIYTTIDKYSRPDSFVNKKTKIALQEYKKDALMAKKLAKIVTDVPVKLDLEAAKISRFDTLNVKELFDKLSFKSLWRRVLKAQNSKFKSQNSKNQKDRENIEERKHGKKREDTKNKQMDLL